MTYTHLTTNELVMIEAYYQAGKKVCDISKSLEGILTDMDKIKTFMTGI
ncbi:hypothetical protein [Streptococcus sp. S784/96/1]|nr:hypothetical protein [Streptococcus sp. S784/96/1]